MLQELFNVVDEDCDGRVQSGEVLLLVLTALEGARKTHNTQELGNMQGENTEGDSTQKQGTIEISTQEKNAECVNTESVNTRIVDTVSVTTQIVNTEGCNTQNQGTIEISTQENSMQEENAEGDNTQEEDTNVKEAKTSEIDEEEIKHVLNTIEKDENGMMNFLKPWLSFHFILKKKFLFLLGIMILWQ